MHSCSQWSFYLDKASICQHPLSLGAPGRGVTTVMAVTRVTREVTRLGVVTTDRMVTRRVVTVVGQILQPIQQHLEKMFKKSILFK